MSEPVKVAIVISGGLVQAVISAGVPVECVIVDYDTDGADESDLVDMSAPSAARESFALLRLEDAETDGPFVLHAFELEAARSAETVRQSVESGSYEYQATLDRYDRGDLDDVGAIAELQRAGWTERRAYSILEQHQNN